MQWLLHALLKKKEIEGEAWGCSGREIAKRHAETVLCWRNLDYDIIAHCCSLNPVMSVRW